jgi:predicted  nucleic acid-binding Zn-ribbon protein
MMTWTISSRRKKLRFNDRGSNDLVKIIDSQNDKIEDLSKALDIIRDENQALYLEIKNLQAIEESHKKLNGKLREEIIQLKKDAKDMLNYP